MGVKGLQTFCFNHEDELSTFLDKISNVTLAVDYDGFVNYLCERLYVAAATESGLSSRAWLLFGGCPDRLEAWITTWLNAMKKQDISLIFVRDPPRCFGGEAQAHRKGWTWVDRNAQKNKRVAKLVDQLFSSASGEMCMTTSNVKETENLLHGANGVFPFASEKLRGTLMKHGISVRLAQREADEDLAQLVRTDKAYAVLGQDSDFFCMPSVRYIPFSYIEVPMMHSESPPKARIFYSTILAQALGLEDKQLVDLAIVCGNDFTPPIDEEFGLAKKLDFPDPRPTRYVDPMDAAEWIREHGSICQHFLLPILETQAPGVMTALFEIYRFYGQEDFFMENCPDPSVLRPVQLSKKKRKSYSSLINNFNYPLMAFDVIESKNRRLSSKYDPLQVHPSADVGNNWVDLLAPVRKMFYSTLNASHVTEIDTRSDGSRTVDVKIPKYLQNFLKLPMGQRSGKALNDVLRSMVLKELYGNPNGVGPAQSLTDMFGNPNKNGLVTRTFAYALLLLIKCAPLDIDGSPLVTGRRMDLLLITSIVCVHSKSVTQRGNHAPKNPPTLLSDNQVQWGDAAVVAGYIELLRLVYYMRIVLGEKMPPNAGCASYFSSEVFAKVASTAELARDMSRSKSVSFEKKELRIILEEFKPQLQMSVANIASLYSNIRASMDKMVKLMPKKDPIAQVTSKLDAMQLHESSENSSEMDASISDVPSTPTSTKLSPIHTSPSTSETSQTPSRMSSLIPSSVTKRTSAKTSSPSPTAQTPSPTLRAPSAEIINQSPTAAMEDKLSSPDENVSEELAPTPHAEKDLTGLIKTLPVYAHRQEIIDTVSKNQLTVIQGETGCGKSTSVPQFLYDAWTERNQSVNVYVTQPRRIAAIELASTVAKMRKNNKQGEDGKLGSTIGYRIGQKQVVSSKTKITYVTTGYMVERLIHNAESLQSVTHIVLDEVHERSMDVDLLLLLLRLNAANYPNLRLVIMSATMDARVIVKYFKQHLAAPLLRAKPLFVGTKLYPVEYVFLDKLKQYFPEMARSYGKKINEVTNHCGKLVSQNAMAGSDVARQAISKTHQAQLELIPHMVRSLIEKHRQDKDHRLPESQCILIFVPGINSINTLYETLSPMTPRYNGEPVRLLVLHSGIELENQEEAFQVHSGRATKIVLSTNIAESSVTIPDVTHVINCGVEKNIEMPNAGSSHAEVLVDAWCSRASAKQRSGRAGRVMPGTAFHLMPEEFFTKCLAEYSTPEILRKPLDRTILLLKAKMKDYGIPSDLLAETLNAPSKQNVAGAYRLLARHEALDSDIETKAEMTRFGEFVCHIPLSLELCRLLMTGMFVSTKEEKSSKQSSWRILLHTVILVAILSAEDLFTKPSFYHAHSPSSYMEDMKENLAAKMGLDKGEWSEPLSMWAFYCQILSTKPKGLQDRRWKIALTKNCISHRRFQTLNFIVSDICGRLVRLARREEGRFGQMLDEGAVKMLGKLENYASSQNASDPQLVQMAKKALQTNGDGRQITQALRFLIVHNFDENLIVGKFQPSNAKKSQSDTEEATLKLGKEEAASFASLKSGEKMYMFDQLATQEENVIKAVQEQPTKIRITFKANPPTSSDIAPEFALPSLPISLLHYVVEKGFPVNLGRVVSQDTEHSHRFRLGETSTCKVTWSPVAKQGSVYTTSRSLFGLPLRNSEATQKKQAQTQFRAVYAERTYLGDESKMHAGKCTLLPSGSAGYFPILLLLTARRGKGVFIHVGQTTGQILAVTLNAVTTATMPKGYALDCSVLDPINTCRQALSDSFNANSESDRLAMEHILAFTDDANYVVKKSEDTFKMVKLNMAGRPASKEGEETFESRYPPFVG